MRHLLATSAILAAAHSHANSWTVALNPVNGGSQTEVAWLYQDFSYEVYGPNNTFTGGTGLNGDGTANEFGALAFETLPLPSSFNGLTTGIFYTNLRTLETVAVDQIYFNYFNFSGFEVVQVAFFHAPLAVNSGDILEMSGLAQGSVVLDLDFSIFNNGTWTEGNRSLLVGSPVPEPSTYGLILGGLALAGAAVRRRRAKRA